MAFVGDVSKQGALRVGVTLFVRDEHQTIWENGIFQNTFFLLATLKKSPVVAWCGIVISGEPKSGQLPQFLKNIDTPIVSMAEAMNEVDVIIELSAQINPEWGREFVQGGGRIVGMRVANDYIIDAERMAFGLSPGQLMSGVPYHEIWTLPAFEKTCAAYYEVGLRAPVRTMQHLWSPALLEQAVSAHGLPLPHYQPGRAKWRLTVLEPNICSVKTCHIPLLTAECAYRQRPEMVEILRVFSAQEIRDNAIFVNFAKSLDLVKHGVATFEGRYPIYDLLGKYADAIICHHWENAQNYLYYEALYFGFPLIHNSSMIDGCGYRYADFDCEDGGRALIQAYAQHDRNLDHYYAESRRFLAKLDPHADANVRLYSEALAALFQPDRAAAATP